MCGDTFNARYRSVDAEESINLYPNILETKEAKSNIILAPTPGRSVLQICSTPNHRGCAQNIERFFFVSYNILYEMLADNSLVQRGVISTSFSGTVSMAFNIGQLMIVDGTPTGGFILDLATNVFTQITAPAFQGGVTVSFIDGYFIINRPNTGYNQISAINDGLTWEPFAISSAEASPDNLTAIVVLNKQVYLLGQTTIEVLQNTGGTGEINSYPLERIQGAFIQCGTNSPFSAVQVQDTIIFLGYDKDGTNVIWAIENYKIVRVSNQAIECYLSQYDLTNATAFSSQYDGHYFVQFNIPNSPKSIVYDLATKMFHYRSRWNPVTAMYERDRANFHAFVFDKHITLDYANGNIYSESLSTYSDDTFIIKRVRTFPYITKDMTYQYFKDFRLDCQVGVGTISGNPYDVNPLIALSFSDDNASTRSSTMVRSLGLLGQHNHQVWWMGSLGKSRYRVFTVEVTANVPVVLIAAFCEVY